VRTLLPLLAVPLVAAACGGGSASGTTTASTTTAASEAEFVSAGNKICMSSDRRIFKIGRLTRDPKGWSLTAASARRAVREMRALKPPADRASAFNLMMRYANALSLTIQEVHALLVRKNIDAAAQATLAGGRLQNKVHEYAKAAGLTFCQQALTNWPA
jgi:hypothetical protein